MVRVHSQSWIVVGYSLPPHQQPIRYLKPQLYTPNHQSTTSLILVMYPTCTQPQQVRYWQGIPQLPATSWILIDYPVHTTSNQLDIGRIPPPPSKPTTSWILIGYPLHPPTKSVGYQQGTPYPTSNQLDNYTLSLTPLHQTSNKLDIGRVPPCATSNQLNTGNPPKERRKMECRKTWVCRNSNDSTFS